MATPIWQRFADPRYGPWRTAVLARDGYECVACGRTAKDAPRRAVQPHHMKDWHNHPELRFVVDNGRTLCVVCHKTLHSWIRTTRQLGHPMPQKVREAISRTLKGRVPANKGIKLPDSWRQAISTAGKGRKQSAEHVAKRISSQRAHYAAQRTAGKPHHLQDKPRTPSSIEASRQGNLTYYQSHDGPNKGKTQTPEHRAGISEALKGRSFSPEHRANLSRARRKRTIPRDASSGRFVSPQDGESMPSTMGDS